MNGVSFKTSPRTVRNVVGIFCALSLVTGQSATGETERVAQRRVQEDGPVMSYRWIVDAPSGVRFQLVQRVPDQTRSFYIGRGFALEAADRYASACVMQTIVNNNTADRILALDLANWRVVHGGRKRPLKLTAQWQQEWEQRGVPESARIAFQWSQLPNTQVHQPGDWFQGMIAAELPPASVFDLQISWNENGTEHTATIKDLQCAEDRNLGDTK